MKYRVLGRTGLRCSEIGLGTWAFASQIYGDVDRGDAVQTVGRAIEEGVNFFDTAPLYGDDERDGISEEVLGKALGDKLDSVIISTKFGRYSTDGAAPNFHARRANESVNGSLRRLGRDHIDVLFFHSPFGPDDIHDDVWEALDKLRDAGKIRFVGHSISMFAETEGMARSWAAERRIDVIQVVYSLMNRESTDLIRDLGDQGVGIVARESLANGFLSGTVTKDTVFPEGHLNARYSRDEISDRVDYVNDLSFLIRGPITSVPQAAYRWVLDNSDVSLVLSGASNEDQLTEVTAVSDVSGYTNNELRRANEIHKTDFQAA
jgi:aryl-alcohol dehydrogenase-like predicted oxidoreductase